jgi:DNA repair protein RadA/Sms
VCGAEQEGGRDRPVGKGTACFGEVGLTGDVRYVSGAQRRTSEMAKMGFGRIIRPESTSDGPPDNETGGGSRREASVVEVNTLEEAVAVALL